MSDITNATVSESEEEEKFFLPEVRTFLTVLVCVQCLVTVSANGLVMLAYSVDSNELRNPHDTYILNLAVCDFLVAVFVVPVSWLDVYNNYYWKLPMWFCKVWVYAEYFLTSEALLAVILISWDRYRLVSLGAAYTQRCSVKMATVYIAISWFTALLENFPGTFLWEAITGETIPHSFYCDGQFSSSLWYMAGKNLFTIVCPGAVLVYFNVRVYKSINSKNKVKPTQTTFQEANISKERKASITIFILSAIFAVTWLPTAFYSTLITACDEACYNDYVYITSYWLFYITGLINPFLYAGMSPRFQKNYLKLWNVCLLKTAESASNQRVSSTMRLQ